MANFVFPEEKAVYITSEESVLTVCSSSPMPNRSHEEADARIVVHVLHALQQGLTTVQVRTVDTDVVVVLIGVFHKLLLSQPKADIWVAFGVGKKYRHYSINALSTSLGTKRSQALPMLHARFLDATQPLLFGEQGRSRSGKLGWRLKRLQTLLSTSLHILLSPLIPTVRTFVRLSG